MATPKRKKKTTPKADIYAKVTEQIIQALEAGTVPWRKPWDPTVGMPLSMSTGKSYRGINIMLLALSSQVRGFTSPFWGTYKKITESGGQVRKGESSTFVTLWKTGVRDVVTEGEVERKRWAVLRSYLVFNACQADGLPEKFMVAPNAQDHDPIQACQLVLDGYVQNNGPSLRHAAGEGAYYAPFQDSITLPAMEAFSSVEGYYSTAFHETTHSTGHQTRLNREGVTRGFGDHKFGDELYSKEELIAEMGAAMLCGVTGIEQVNLDQSAAYIRSWISALTDDGKLLVSAAGQAQKAADLIQGITFEAEGTDDVKQTPDIKIGQEAA